MHQTCLQQWIKSSDTRCCELCKYEFIMETKLKPLRKVRAGRPRQWLSAGDQPRLIQGIRRRDGIGDLFI